MPSLRDIDAARPDHIAVTGDLVNIALAAEFPPARSFLDRLGPPDRVSFVPGNHDAYVRATMDHSSHHWGDFMRGEGAAAGVAAKSGFPFVRRRGPVALIGLSTALPTAPMMATGWLGGEQLARLADELAASQARRTCSASCSFITRRRRPQASTSSVSSMPRRFCRCSSNTAPSWCCTATAMCDRWFGSKGRTGKSHAVGVPSASAASTLEPQRAGYNLYRIDGDPGRWTLRDGVARRRAGSAGNRRSRHAAIVWHRTRSPVSAA